MPRDTHGKPHRPEGPKAAEPIKAGTSGDKDSTQKMAASAKDPDDIGDLRAHHDRLTRIEHHLGMDKGYEGFKAEDQGGKKTAGPEHPKEHEKRDEKKNERERSGEPSYKRRRH